MNPNRLLIQMTSLMIHKELARLAEQGSLSQLEALALMKYVTHLETLGINPTVAPDEPEFAALEDDKKGAEIL